MSGQKTQSSTLENRKCSTKEIKNKWAETGFSVCYCEKPAEGNGVSIQKSQTKPSLTPKQKKTRLQWAEEKQSWTVAGWMKGIFRDMQS